MNQTFGLLFSLPICKHKKMICNLKKEKHVKEKHQCVLFQSHTCYRKKKKKENDAAIFLVCWLLWFLLLIASKKKVISKISAHSENIDKAGSACKRAFIFYMLASFFNALPYSELKT